MALKRRTSKVVSGSASSHCEAGLRRAELRGGVEQGDLDPLGALALPERDREPACQPGLDLGGGAGLLGQVRDQRCQVVGDLVLEHEVLHGAQAVLQRVARGAGLAFGGDRAVGAGAVAAGGLDLGGGGRVAGMAGVRLRVRAAG